MAANAAREVLATRLAETLSADGARSLLLSTEVGGGRRIDRLSIYASAAHSAPCEDLAAGVTGKGRRRVKGSRCQQGTSRNEISSDW